jgi:hypothetical protein
MRGCSKGQLRCLALRLSFAKSADENWIGKGDVQQ